MQRERIRSLNDKPEGSGSYVLYWMHQSQRADGNQALEYAVRRANDLGIPVLTVCCLADRHPDANQRHVHFMLEGLSDVAARLNERGIGFLVTRGEASEDVGRLAAKAALVVCDRGYLRHARSAYDQLADRCKVQVVQVEDNAVVPAEVVSTKKEYAARTIRPKIHKHLDRFLEKSKTPKVTERWSDTSQVSTVTKLDPAAMLKKLDVDSEAALVTTFAGGRTEALKCLQRFVNERLEGYSKRRSDPSLGATSTLSPYLHYGHIAPWEIVDAVRESGRGSEEDRDVLVEELVIRRELSINYVLNEPHYDRFDGLPDWARKTLGEHKQDKRPHVYSVEQLEASDTHDAYWNAAMTEMVKTGFMHNYMRMYWGKKILEWTADPEDAFYTALYLNNKYFLDGRDPNSYAGVGWVFGLHDRPWARRPIFGTVRYMNANGLKRKFDIDRYVERVEDM